MKMKIGIRWEGILDIGYRILDMGAFGLPIFHLRYSRYLDALR